MKKLISIICVLALLISTGLVNVFAALEPLWAGDTNLDGNSTIKDATLVQKYIAKMTDFTFLQKEMADADSDGSITVKDATAIQKHVAKIEKLHGSVYPYVHVDNFYYNFDSGKAMTGEPVTFTAIGYSSEKAGPLTYEFYVNDELIYERCDKNSFTYTFEDTGEYKVELKMYNVYDFSATGYELYYEVVEPYQSEKPFVKAFYSPQSYNKRGRFDPGSENLTFIVEAIGGKGDYEYAFLLDGQTIRGYSEDNTFIMEKCPEESENSHVLTVRVKDSSTGEDFVTADYIFEIAYLPPA